MLKELFFVYARHISHSEFIYVCMQLEIGIKENANNKIFFFTYGAQFPELNQFVLVPHYLSLL